MSGKINLTYNAKNVRELSRLITLVEEGGEPALSVLQQVHENLHNAHVLGVTGPPGAGKSTLVDQIITEWRAQNKTVAVVAIDPSSPFSGGAVLGDRIRMQRHSSDEGVYIRSLGSRGAHGGLSNATRAIVEIFDAYGFDLIIIETVGVGQSEFNVMELSDTTLVVLVPEAGDTVQTLKAGLLEVADIFVLNKGDRPGADQMVNQLQAMIGLVDSSGSHQSDDHDEHHKITKSVTTKIKDDSWRVPVVKTSATKREGVNFLVETIVKHQEYLATNKNIPEMKNKLRRQIFLELCAQTLLNQLVNSQDSVVQKTIDEVSNGGANPYEAVSKLINALNIKRKSN